MRQRPSILFALFAATASTVVTAQVTTKGLQTDPASPSRKQNDFGCGLMRLYPSRGGVVEGVFVCGKSFKDGHLKVCPCGSVQAQLIREG